MTIWKTFPETIQRPAYRSLADLISNAIDTGDLEVGARLPTHRELAYQLNLSVQTISRAYDELIRRGLIEGQVGRGTFVSAGPAKSNWPFVPAGHDGQLIDLSILKPVTAPLHRDKMSAALAELSGTLADASIFSFKPSNALEPFKSSAISWLARCGLSCAPDAVVMTNGATSAMTTALLTAANAGDLVLTEAMSHHTLVPLSRYLDLRLEGVPIDSEGIVPGELEKICKAKPVKSLYVMPSGLNPLALMMGEERRKALAELARKFDFTIIENDAWGPLQPDRPPPIAVFAPERTFYFTSFTKCLLPGLRHGYLVVPDLLASAAANRHLVTDWVATPIMAEIASLFIENGTADELLAWQMGALGRRNAVVAKVLEGIPFGSSPNGMHVWLPLPGSWTEEAFVAHARRKGVAVAPGSAFAVSDQAVSAGVRICIGGMEDGALAHGLQLIARLYKSPPEPALLAL
ncbi:PLP-dependent aminotransferase family protein [Roseibium sp. MMSF_3544]|uniref:MocR-like ectoine utilization transcription factor EhuR n=1 Tax=unclassified Roseibium TaxID=2629323 RepID=UPI00273EBB10|nr:PLP-dependent aminotransferase family protein [Roseibium sp. MMSF_3544]